MVEQTNAGEGHCHVIFVAGLNDIVVPDGAAGLSNVLNAAAVRPFDVIAEREKRIRAERVFLLWKAAPAFQ